MVCPVIRRSCIFTLENSVTRLGKLYPVGRQSEALGNYFFVEVAQMLIFKKVSS